MHQKFVAKRGGSRVDELKLVVFTEEFARNAPSYWTLAVAPFSRPHLGHDQLSACPQEGCSTRKLHTPPVPATRKDHPG
eukprot:3107281-Amphidinium_carterae.1